jgi:hypothetical protein
MLLFVILNYYRLFHLKLFFTILRNYNTWLLVVILFVAIDGYYIGAYCIINYY